MKKTYIALCLCLFAAFGAITVIYSANDLYTTYTEAQNALDAFNLKLEPLRTKLKVLEDRRETMTKGKWKLVISMINPIEIAKALALEASEITAYFDLDAQIFAVQAELEPYQAEMKRLETARDTAYDNYVASLSPSEKPKEKSEAPVTYVEIKEYRVECRNSCGTIFSSKDVGLANLAETAEKAHLILCGSEPHKSKGVGYYSCPPDYVKVCPQSGEHWKESEQKLACRGGCGTLFPRLLGDIPDDASHRTQTKCGEKSWHSRSVRIGDQDLTEQYVDDCPQGTYYHCNTNKSCPNAGSHVGSGETVTKKYIDSNGNEVPNPATPLACGHTVGSKGIHLRVSCEFCSEQFYFCAEGSEHGMARCPRNESGETCTVSGGRMILCADPPHVHQYPSDPKQTQADASPTSESHTPKNDGKTNKPDGKTPKQTGASKEMVLAACGVHTIEKGSSSAHSHREVSCRLDGYGNACDPGSYYVCQEDEHRHQYPNTPKGFRKVIVCPAHAWTGCKGTKSHAETCPAGHSYYTCNKAATAAHEAHTASDAPSSPPQQNPDPNNEGGDSSEGVRVCGHPKSQGGDHTFVASCAATNADGESCERTSGYWTCKGHTHKFPNGDSNANTNKGGDSSEGVHKCGHPKSQGGDHSFVASCAATNADGASCERTSGYWTCKGHTHKFPEPEARRLCGHLKSASGDHSFIASCAATNADGASCERTSGYWTCKGHTHKFPESSSSSSSSSSSANNNNDDTDDDDSDSDSDPDDTDDDDDEPVGKCGASHYTGCEGAAGEHARTCAAGHSYYSCNETAAARHAKH